MGMMMDMQQQKSSIQMIAFSVDIRESGLLQHVMNVYQKKKINGLRSEVNDGKVFKELEELWD
jgi:hypothetical protein